MDYVEDDLRAEFVFNNPNSNLNLLFFGYIFYFSKKKYCFSIREPVDVEKAFMFEDIINTFY